MATHRSAEKRNRQNIKRRERNRDARATIRTEIKKSVQLADQGNLEEAKVSAKKAASLLDTAAIHGLHHQSNAARSVSRLYAHINKASAAQ